MGIKKQNQSMYELKKLPKSEHNYGLLVSQYETTQEEFENIMGYNPSVCPIECTPEKPVNNVDILEIVKFANKKSEKDGFEPVYNIKKKHFTINPTANGYRLPTEFEWEYLAQGGVKNIFSGTSSNDNMCLFGNIQTVTGEKPLTGSKMDFYCQDGVEGLATIGSFQPNQLQLYDLTGNIAEVVLQAYERSSTDILKKVSLKDSLVYKGGHYKSRVKSSLNAKKNKYSGKSKFVGFRLVRTNKQ